ncbi:MAG: MoaD/ThiS family protein [Nitrospira sp.]|nr:MAG: MoaD/ThiS family protein [Nitrospira sp.]
MWLNCSKKPTRLQTGRGYTRNSLRTGYKVPMITVLIFGLTLRDAVGETEFDCKASEPTTVRKLIESNQDRMGPLLQFLLNREVMIAVNKKVSGEDTVIKDGDIVKLSYQSRTSYDGTRDIPV